MQNVNGQDLGNTRFSFERWPNSSDSHALKDHKAPGSANIDSNLLGTGK